MKKLKKIIILISFISVAVLSCTACGSGSDNKNEGSVLSVPFLSGASNSDDSSGEQTSDESSKAEESAQQSSSQSSAESSAESSVQAWQESVQESSVQTPPESSAETSEPQSVPEISLPEENKLSYIFNMDNIKSGIESMEKQLSNDTVSVKMTLEDEYTVVLTCTAKNQLDADKYYEYFEQITNQSESKFNQFVDQLKGLAKMDYLTLIVRYNNVDGKTIYEKMFFGNDSDSSSIPSSPESSAAESSAEVSQIVPSSGLYSDLNEFVADPELQTMIQPQIESFKEKGFDVKLYVEDETKLVYEFKVLNMEITPELVQEFREGLESNTFKSSFESIAQSVENAVLKKGTSIIVRYSNASGSVLAEKEFFPDYNL